MKNISERTEYLGNNITAFVSKEYTFGTDAILLSNFVNLHDKDYVCDLGTGCGIIPLLWTSNNHTNKIAAVEIQKKACTLFQKSIKHNNLHNIKVYNHDLKNINEILQSGMFDIVSINPPYFNNNSGYKNANESSLIARHEILCNIYDISKCASYLLKYSGSFYLCHKPERLCDVFEALRKNNLEPKQIRMVVQKENMSPWLVLIEAKKGGKPGLMINKQLIMKNSDDTYTKEFRKFYGEFATF